MQTTTQPDALCQCGHSYQAHKQHPDPKRGTKCAGLASIEVGTKSRKCACRKFKHEVSEVIVTPIATTSGPIVCRCGCAKSLHCGPGRDGECAANGCGCGKYNPSPKVAGVVVGPCKCGHLRNSHKRQEFGNTPDGMLIEYVECQTRRCKCAQYLPDETKPTAKPSGAGNNEPGLPGLPGFEPSTIRAPSTTTPPKLPKTTDFEPASVLDPEFAAMHTIVDALKTLDSDARYRVLEYIKSRYR